MQQKNIVIVVIIVVVAGVVLLPSSSFSTSRSTTLQNMEVLASKLTELLAFWFHSKMGNTHQAWREGPKKGGARLKKCVCVSRHFQI